MTESDIILYCQIAIGLGLLCIGICFGYWEGYSDASRKVINDCRRDKEILRAIFPK